MWLCILLWRRFEDTFKKLHWSQVNQVPTVWLCIPSDRRFKERSHSENKSNKCKQCDYASSQASNMRSRLNTHNRQKFNMCNQCDYAICIPWDQVGDLRNHFKIHKKRYLCLLEGMMHSCAPAQCSAVHTGDHTMGYDLLTFLHGVGHSQAAARLPLPPFVKIKTMSLLIYRTRSHSKPPSRSSSWCAWSNRSWAKQCQCPSQEIFI